MQDTGSSAGLKYLGYSAKRVVGEGCDRLDGVVDIGASVSSKLQ